MHDGFGIVIVTLAMKGSAEIVLVDEGDDDEGTLSWSFELQKGEMYVLSDNSRNKCMHGVIAVQEGRESLNLRLGLHSRESAYNEIDKHWR